MITDTESCWSDADLTLPFEQRVMRADNGVDTPLDQLTCAGASPLLWSLDERMRLVKRRAPGAQR